ncbi:hypothetical protein BD779DRAFT_1019149 [Infundibulicybe gibba]|nr:hypothetical protein BD779DRAFT_1019149 [Infundibulicybe gibba]
MDALTPELAAWVKSTARQFGSPSEKYFIDSCCAEYGPGGVARTKMAMESLLAGAPAVSASAIRLGDKPAQNETVVIKKLTEDIFIRIWGDKFKDANVFTFDFINRHGAYMRTPPGVRIFAVNSPIPNPEVYSIEQCLSFANVRPTQQGPIDHEWETFAVVEGTQLRIECPGRSDYYLKIPLHRPRIVIFLKCRRIGDESIFYCYLIHNIVLSTKLSI